MFNGNPIPGAKEPLLVKFADGGNKKKSLYNKQDNNGRAWRDNNDTITQVIMVMIDHITNTDCFYSAVVRNTQPDRR